MILQSITNKEPIHKGWSGDTKYLVTTENAKYLMRVSSLDYYEGRKNGFDNMKKVSELGVRMCQPIEFGTCDEGVYILQSWIEGEDAEELMATFSKDKQYTYGLEAGQMMRKIHSIPAPATLDDWEVRFNQKIDRKIAMYEACEVQYDYMQHFVRYIEKNRHLLAGRPQSYQHGDYHIGNMMIDKQGNLVIIDFDRDDYGDPWEEFNRIVWSAQNAPSFATGMVDGYFDHQVPTLFWQLLALYISNNTLSSIPWAIAYGNGEIDTMTSQAKEVLAWYDNMTKVIPAWYETDK